MFSWRILMGFPLAVVACAGPDKGPAGVAEVGLPNPLRLKALFLIFLAFRDILVDLAI